MATSAMEQRGYRFAIGPLCLSISVLDFEAWLNKADVGAKLVYARGPVLDQKRDVVTLVRQYVAEKEVITHQRKVEGVWEYYVVRRSPERDARPAKGAPVRSTVPAAETPQGRMLAILQRCLTLGVPARTNAELAREMGLKDAEAARYIFNQLVDASVITAQNMGVRQRRVVTFIATGKSTVKGVL